MWEYIVIAVLIVGAFVAGFFVGKKNGQKFATAAQSLKDTIKKV